MKKDVIVIDNYDSFTYNLVHYLEELGSKTTVIRNDKLGIDDLKKFEKIVLSPGPGSPKDYPTTSKIYKKYKGRKKIIGICLGYQMILHNEGGKIIQQKKIYHGFQSKIKIQN